MPQREPPAEVVVTPRLVRHLLRVQHPDLADLALRRLGTGWDTEVFRLGRELSVRVPRRQLGAQLIETEVRWLPRIADDLPLPVPTPVRVGRPSADFAWPWSVCAYVPGRPLGARSWSGRSALRAADTVAAFLAALHRPAPPGAPVNPFRGRPLSQRADSVADALRGAPAPLRSQLTEVWALALAAPEYDGPPVWVHGDLHPRNLLVGRAGATGVIDFGDLGAGDPATDLAAAWMAFDAPGRRRMRAAMGGSDDLWTRARGWALFFGLMFHRHRFGHADNAAIGVRTLTAVGEPD